MGKTNLICFIKKIKSPIELTSSTELDDDKNKERSEKEELEEKDSYYLDSNFDCKTSNYYNCNKHKLNFHTLIFKSHFKEVVTPPPELI